MLGWIKGLRIGRNELLADAVFLFVSMAVSGFAIYIFDIHWSFYPGNTIFPPNKHIFTDPTLYYIGIPLGGIIGFILLKLTAWGFIIEEDDHLKMDGKKDGKRDAKGKKKQN